MDEEPNRRITEKSQRKTTHMFLNGKKIKKIDDLSRMKNIEILYAHNNLLKNVDSISTLERLTHLYLQWNRIDCIKNLRNLPFLRNLYLCFNCITTVKGLEGMPHLKILHVQKQKIASPGGTLKFDLDTLKNISVSLTELNAAGNHLTSIKELNILRELTLLDVSNNMLSNREETYSALSMWKSLQNLDVRGNPLMWTNRRCEYDMISVCANLKILNSKIVRRSTRSFLQTLRHVRIQREKLRETKKRIQFSSETRSFVNQLPAAIQEIVSQSVTLNERK